MPQEPTALILMYVILPLWLLAGFSDWLCHRASRIETTSGPKESLIHLLMFAEMGLPLLAALFLEINALVIAFMILMFLAHEATSLWDVSYATTMRRVTPVEQHIHSFLEMLPLTGLLLIIARHWPQFIALFGLGAEAPSFGLTWKGDVLPPLYVATALAGAVLFGLLPYIEELVRGVRARRSIGEAVELAKETR